METPTAEMDADSHHAQPIVESSSSSSSSSRRGANAVAEGSGQHASVRGDAFNSSPVVPPPPIPSNNVTALKLPTEKGSTEEGGNVDEKVFEEQKTTESQLMKELENERQLLRAKRLQLEEQEMELLARSAAFEDEVAATRAELAEKRILLDAECEELQRDRLLLRSGNMFDSEPSSTLEAKLTVDVSAATPSTPAFRDGLSSARGSVPTPLPSTILKGRGGGGSHDGSTPITADSLMGALDDLIQAVSFSREHHADSMAQPSAGDARWRKQRSSVPTAHTEAVDDDAPAVWQGTVQGWGSRPRSGSCRGAPPTQQQQQQWRRHRGGRWISLPTRGRCGSVQGGKAGAGASPSMVHV